MNEQHHHQDHHKRKVAWSLWLPAALLAAMAAYAGCSNDAQLGVVYQGTRLEAIDLHLHTGHWDDITESGQHALAEKFPFPFSLDAESFANSALQTETVLEELDAAGLRTGLLLAVYAPRSVGVATNEMVIKRIEESKGRLYGMASLRVDNWKQDKDKELKRLEQALAHDKMIGVKLAHTHMHFRFDDPAYFGIYKVAAKADAPVYLHTGPSPFPGTADGAEYTDPAYVEEAIASHPTTRFVLGHLGYDFVNKKHAFLETCLKLAERYNNVFLEPSAMGSAGSDPTSENLIKAMKRIKQQGLIDRLIYGSDGPQFPGFLEEYLQRTLAAMQSAGYTTEEVKAVLKGNFERVYKVSIDAATAEP